MEMVRLESAMGYVTIAENNISAISTLYICNYGAVATVNEKNKPVAAIPETGYYRGDNSRYLWTYSRDIETGAIKTKWTLLTNQPLAVPTEQVLLERRGILHYDHNKKFWVFDDVTYSLLAYLEEKETDNETEDNEETETEDNEETETPRYYANFNRPGYLPESDGWETENFDDAVEYLCGEIEREAEVIETEIELTEEKTELLNERVDNAIAALRASGSEKLPVEVMFNGYCYFIAEAEVTETV